MWKSAPTPLPWGRGRGRGDFKWHERSEYLFPVGRARSEIKKSLHNPLGFEVTFLHYVWCYPKSVHIWVKNRTEDGIMKNGKESSSEEAHPQYEEGV